MNSSYVLQQVQLGSNQMSSRRLSFRRSLYPAGSAGHRPGWSSDAEVQHFRQRCQQVVHRFHPDLRVLRHTAAAHWLLHPEGRRGLSSQVDTQAWGTNFTIDREIISHQEIEQADRHLLLHILTPDSSQTDAWSRFLTPLSRHF